MDYISPNILFLLHMTTYWSLSFVFFIMDMNCDQLTNKFNLKTNKYPIDWSFYLETVKVSLKSQIFILLPLINAFFPFYTVYDHLSIYTVIYSFALSVLFEEFYFYYVHRLLHTKKLYKYHALHHKVISPVATATLYSSFVENLFCNFLPVVLVPLLVPMNWYSMCVWNILATASAVCSHNGFKFLPMLTKFHSYHHLFKTCNYGTNGLLDYLNGTYKQDE